MKGGDLDNRPTHRYLVMAEAVFVKNERQEEEKRGWFRTMFSKRVVWIPNRAALSELWRFSSNHGVRMELAFVGELAQDATYLWEALDRDSANPFNDWHVFESIDNVVEQIPFRPDILGYVDTASRYMVYGGKGLTVGALR